MDKTHAGSELWCLVDMLNHVPLRVWLREQWTSGIKNFLDRASLLIPGSENATRSLQMLNLLIRCSRRSWLLRSVVLAAWWLLKHAQRMA